MYKNYRQHPLECFEFPLGKLDSDNRWAVLAEHIPWDMVEDIYAVGFINNGAPAHPARMAFGCLIIKQILDCSDRELVAQVAENPYLQYFIGMEGFEFGCPFGASTMVAFRKRFSDEDLCRINDEITRRARVSDEPCSEEDDGDSDSEGGGGSGGCGAKANAGVLVIDATVAPSDIAYPTDTRLLNGGREKLEAMIDTLHAQVGGKKPRTYRISARKNYLKWSKSRKKSAKVSRRARAQQLGFVGRDLGYIDAYLENGGELGEHDCAMLATIRMLYAQQAEMHRHNSRSVDHRIVSLAQPWVRPIVRGKAKAPTEFGCKVHASIEKGFVHIEHLSFEAYNECERLRPAWRSLLCAPWILACPCVSR